MTTHLVNYDAMSVCSISDKMDEVELDDESPLGVGSEAYSYHKSPQDDDSGSPPDIDLDGSGSLDGLSHRPGAHAGQEMEYWGEGGGREVWFDSYGYYSK